MAVVAPAGAVATALRTVPYWKQARSASDTRPHQALPGRGLASCALPDLHTADWPDAGATHC